jgi:hypothetical protein
MVFAVGQALGAWAFVLLIDVRSKRRALIDQSNILLTLIILWAYLSFMQYLIVWSGNLPEEVIWFNHRTQNGWKWFAYLLILFQFALPFSALLFRDLKRRSGVLTTLCLCILLLRVVDRFWLVMPGLYPESVSISWLDFTLLFGLGGIWLSVFFSKINRELVYDQA